jgi:hypothetical protein
LATPHPSPLLRQFCPNAFGHLSGSPTRGEGAAKNPVNEVVWPLLIVMLLANGGENMWMATYGVKNMINSMNNSVHKVVDLEVIYQKAYKALAGASFGSFLMQSLYSSCEANIDQAKLNECLTIIFRNTNANRAFTLSIIK